MLSIIAVAFLIGFIIAIHELGHLIAAKLTGMEVTEYAIGFGPKLFSFQKGETIYSLRAIPLGGFNKITGESGKDNDAEYNPRAYYSKSVSKRFAVISAGVITNFIAAILLFGSVFYMHGIYESQEDIENNHLYYPTAFESVLLGTDVTYHVVARNVNNLGEAIQGTKEISLTGPVGIARHTSHEAERGMLAYIWCLGMVNAAIGFTNLLPVPITDGGRMVGLIYEGISGKTVSPIITNILNLAGLTAMIGIAIFITIKELLFY